MEDCIDQGRYKWVMLVLLWLLYVAFGIVARSIFPLVTPILKDLSINYSQMGLILGSWQLTYIPAAMMAGGILDGWGVRKAILAGAVIIALSAFLRCFANGFFFMLIAVALFGVGGPMVSIGGPKAISEWFTGKSRGSAVGIYTTGNWIGGFIALSVTNSVVMPLVGYSWRAAFMLYGVMVLAVVLLWYLFYKEPQLEITTAPPAIRRVFYGLVKISAVRILLVMGLLSFAVGHGFSSWLPNILEVKGLSPSSAGWAAALPLATGIPAVLLMPGMIPAYKRGHALAGCSLITLVSLFAVMKANGAALYGALMMFGFFSSPFMPLMLLMLMDLPKVEPRHMGAAGGMFFCVGEIGGFAGPLAMGVLVDVTGTFFTGAIFLASLCLAMFCMSFSFNRRK